jgi:tetratricopeptide (TPR) repeat protein
MDLAAFIYLQLGNTARAVELLQQAVAAAPEEAIYHFRLGQAQMQNKNQEAAIAGLRRAIELRPDFVEAHLELANTYLAAERLGPAIAEYRRVVALDPRNAMALRILTLLQR